MDIKYKELAAKHFGLELEAVTDQHVAVIKAIAEDTREEKAPTLEDPRLKKVDEQEQKIVELERKLAEFSRPDRDPAEAEKDAKILGRIKSLPDLTTAVLDPEEGEDDVKAFRKHWDVLHTLTAVKGYLRGDGVEVRPSVKTFKYWQMLEERYPNFTEAISKSAGIDTATATGGAEWAPTLYSSDLIERVYNETGVAKLFPRVNAPRHSWVLPYSPSGGTVYLAGEATSDAASDYTATEPVSSSKTITSKKLVCRIPWSEEFDEDSVVAAASLFQNHTVRLMSEALDSAIVNGDTTGTHQDTGKSFTSTSVEAAWDGLRDIGMNGMSNSKDFDSVFNADNLLACWAQCNERYLGKPPDQWALLHSPKISHKFFTLVNNDTYKLPVYSHNTPMHDDLVRNGAIMSFYGMGVYPTFAVWSDMNESGIHDNSTLTHTAVVLVHRPSCLLTDRRALSSIMYDQPLKGLRNVITSWRGHFDALQPLADDFIAVGYDITTA